MRNPSRSNHGPWSNGLIAGDRRQIGRGQTRTSGQALRSERDVLVVNGGKPEGGSGNPSRTWRSCRPRGVLLSEQGRFSSGLIPLTKGNESPSVSRRGGMSCVCFLSSGPLQSACAQLESSGDDRLCISGRKGGGLQLSTRRARHPGVVRRRPLGMAPRLTDNDSGVAVRSARVSCGVGAGRVSPNHSQSLLGRRPARPHRPVLRRAFRPD